MHRVGCSYMPLHRNSCDGTIGDLTLVDAGFCRQGAPAVTLIGVSSLLATTLMSWLCREACWASMRWSAVVARSSYFYLLGIGQGSLVWAGGV